MKIKIILRTFFLVILCLGSFSITAKAKKNADNEYAKSARFVDITNQYATGSFLFYETYDRSLLFVGYKGDNIDKEYQWKNLQVSITSSIVIRGVDADNNQCKLTVEPNGKYFSIWVEVRDSDGKILKDVGIREIGSISFGNNPYDYRTSKNVKNGFKLLKEWFTKFLL